MRSIGMFGPGFGAMIAKYGGGAEFAQVGCRAGAVGGGVYVLGRGVENIKATKRHSDSANPLGNEYEIALELSDGTAILTEFVVGCAEDLPKDSMICHATASAPEVSTTKYAADSAHDYARSLRSISIVSSPLSH